MWTIMTLLIGSVAMADADVQIVLTDDNGLTESATVEILGVGEIPGAGVHEVSLAPGAYTLDARARGYYPLIVPLHVPDTDTVEVRFELVPFHAVTQAD